MSAIKVFVFYNDGETGLEECQNVFQASHFIDERIKANPKRTKEMYTTIHGRTVSFDGPAPRKGLLK